MKTIRVLTPSDTLTFKINDTSYDLCPESPESDYMYDYLAEDEVDAIFNGGDWDDVTAALDNFTNQVWIEYIIQNFDKILKAGYTIDDFRDPDDPDYTSYAAADACMKVFKPHASWYINGEKVKDPIEVDFEGAAYTYFGENELLVDEFMEIVENY